MKRLMVCAVAVVGLMECGSRCPFQDSVCIRHGNKVYVSNIGLPFGPNTADGKQNLSIIEL